MGFTLGGKLGIQSDYLIEAALKDGFGKIRALTRNPNSPNAKELVVKGVEVVKADLNDESSLVKAFEVSTHIYGLTDFFEPFAANRPEKAVDIEESTLPNGSRITNGKCNVPRFAAKNKVDDFIKQDVDLLAKTTFFWITFYGDNFQYPIFTPNMMKASGSYIQLSPIPPSTPIKSIVSPSANIGTFALAIFDQPVKTLNGKFVAAYVE